MKKRGKIVLICAAVLAVAAAVVVYAGHKEGSQEELVPKTVKLYGTVEKEGQGEEGRLLMNAHFPDTEGESQVYLNRSDETLILGAEDGLPLSFDSIQDGEMAYAYVSPAMAQSLPPQTFSYVVLTKIPDGYRVPALEEVKSMTKNEDGSAVVDTVSGTSYTVPADCQLLPYLTRNMVFTDDLTEGVNFLVWAEPGQKGQPETAKKIVIFRKGQLAFDQASGPAEEADMAAYTE